MEMTLKRLGLTDLKGILTSATMPLGILMLVAMMVLQLPVFLLDTFFPLLYSLCYGSVSSKKSHQEQP